MKRRKFLLQSSILTAGSALSKAFPAFAADALPTREFVGGNDLYEIFKNPAMGFRPFVRWWWNGDKVEKAELSRELHLMKDAGLGGVEINPIKFPQRTDDLGKPSLQWLGDEWLDALQHTFAEAKSLGLTCDLIVGSGWPFGATYLQGEERAQIVLIGTKKLEGKLDFEASVFDLLKEADPAVSSPHARRKMEILSVKLVPDPFNSMSEVQDLTQQLPTGYITASIPTGKFVLYTLVKIDSFLEVINGAPGADGPVLNHYDKAAVLKYLNHMSDGIQKKTGPLSKHIRAFFTDSMELEGANWTADMEAEFKKRRGYDLMPYLPFTQFKIGSMGNVFDYSYGAQLGWEMKNMIQRVRYDYDLTKTELLQERFIDTFTKWCKDTGVQSRAQAYGRGYFPLEGSLNMDIPECETWIKAGIGKEMSEANTTIGRGYTMVNKYVSSAAHLKGRRVISCEELTNTDVVFNTTLELMKITGDLSTISGVTHPVFHGFNYSPLEAPFPGWVRYGTFINERNNWWPYFKKFNDYKARISALLQQADMFADIAILPPVADMWSIYGAQNEPFPSFSYPNHLSLIWEAMHQNGNGCDYVSESVIRDAEMKDGHMRYGARKYHTIFIVQVESLELATAQKLLAFVKEGGRIFCLDKQPDKSLGWNNYKQRDKEVQDAVEQMKAFPDRFILLTTPEKDFIQWFRDLQVKYRITPYLQINKPDRFVTQVRYQAKDAEILLFINSSMDDSHAIEIVPAQQLTKNKQAWIWNAENGDRYKLNNSTKITLDLGPADSVLVVFDNNKKGKEFPSKLTTSDHAAVVNNWTVEFRHINGSITKTQMPVLKDLKDVPEFVSFSGTAIYRGNLLVADKTKVFFLNLGKVHGVSEVTINNKDLGAQWYGRRIYPIKEHAQTGNNSIEIKVVTTMGNYMKTLKDNAVAQYWTNEKRKDQPIQSMGLIGPVTVA
ncbi:glycosyl hydrolase [Segetibacter aerophilus]|uniref:Glycosyl hydrolase family 2 n=1 Tax=Segetibacter aerophilus TaxID=670293 RepID=A0A512BJU2_9BACT|nr:glycosyl hydrolase [Segetibacter aerophilus]GEO12232.1 glycosyl hydrolase family 2 [Segetibacter aerophilus]